MLMNDEGGLGDKAARLQAPQGCKTRTGSGGPQGCQTTTEMVKEVC